MDKVHIGGQTAIFTMVNGDLASSKERGRKPTRMGLTIKGDG